MNSFVFIHMGGVEGGTTFILVILAVFVLICTHILSYLFFSEYKRWDHSTQLCIVVFLHEKTERTQPNSDHALPPHWRLLAAKRHNFLGFFVKQHTLKCFFSLEQLACQKGDVRSKSINHETLVLRVIFFILGTQKGSIASEKTQFLLQNRVCFCSICLYFSCRGDWWFVELRNF